MDVAIFVVLLFVGGIIAELGDKRRDPGLMIVGIVILIAVMAGGWWLL